VQFTNVLAVLMVDDFEAALPWYTRLFDREPDRRPTPTRAEWQVAEGGSVQVFGTAGVVGGTTVVLGVDDVDAGAAELAGRGIPGEVFTSSDGQLRLASLRDPAGNVVMLGAPAA
jgi:predicted enzyme related to lactoylglutathione lyase